MPRGKAKKKPEPQPEPEPAKPSDPFACQHLPPVPHGILLTPRWAYQIKAYELSFWAGFRALGGTILGLIGLVELLAFLY